MADNSKGQIVENTAAIDVESGDLDEKQLGALTAQVMNNPEVLAAMQSKLAGMVGLPSGYYDTLPAVVKRRVKALKNLEMEKIKIQSLFYKELHELETKYEVKYNPIFQKRNDIVNGVHEPNDEECNYPSDSEDEDEEEAKEKAVKAEEKEEDKDVKGIPEFWLTILKNVDIFAENIQEHDEPILQHLKDIRVTLNKEPEGFKIEFVFSANEYFNNEILTKEYDLRCGPDDDDPMSYDGISIVKCRGCKIDWKKGKNVTEKTVTKKQRHKSKGQVRTVTKTVKSDSFFNFFDPPEVPEKLDDLDDDTHDLLQADWEMGELLRQSIIPRAVLFFTGEALDVEEDYDEEDEEEDDDDDEDEEDSDADEDYSPPKSGGKKGANN
jgi:nucleosome assembly protein 1-like 1